MIDRFTSTLNFQSEALVLRAERQRLLASNIANAETPGYQARDMDFRSALQQATGQIPVKGALATTERAHIPLTRSAREEPNLSYAAPAMTNLDSNTVDMDRERASFADNAVKYEASLRFLNGSIRTMLDAIKGQS